MDFLRRKAPNWREATLLGSEPSSLWEQAAAGTAEQGAARAPTHRATDRGPSSRVGAQGTRLSLHPRSLTPCLDWRGHWQKAPPRQLAHKSSYFLGQAEETKVIRKLPSLSCPAPLRGLAQKRELREHCGWHLIKETGNQGGRVLLAALGLGGNKAIFVGSALGPFS